MELWGLTGLAASGKSEALKILKKKGIPVVDTDVLARVVVDPSTKSGQVGLARVVDHFGKGVLNAQGELDRSAMRARIVASHQDRKALEDILHPLILEEVRRWSKAEALRGNRLGIVEGSRLIESGFYKELKGLLVVVADNELRIKRLQHRDGVSEDQARALLNVQNEQRMIDEATLVWKNDGGLEEFEKQIEGFILKQKEMGRV